MPVFVVSGFNRTAVAVGDSRTSLLPQRGHRVGRDARRAGTDAAVPDLQVLVLTERSDPRVGTSTYRLLNITRTEPPAYLFEVPADYTVRQAGMMKKLEPAQPGK